MLNTIAGAAKHYQIAPIRIHSLIRQVHITKGIKKNLFSEPTIIVETNEIDAYFFENPNILSYWQKAYKEAQSHTADNF